MSTAETYQSDIDKVAQAGLRDAARVLAGIRARLRRALQQGHPPKAGAVRSILLHELVPSLARTMAVAKMIGMSRSKSDSDSEPLQLDWFSEVMKEVRAAGVGTDLTKAQRGYARRVYDSMRHMGTGVDARTRAVIASLITDKTPLPKALKVLDKTLDQLGIGPISRGKLETIYRTESSAAYYAGRWEQDQKDPKVWGYRYLQIERATKRDEHVPLDGTTLPKNALFWRKYWPPNGWNCGCHIQTLYKKAKEVLPGKINGEVPKPDKGFKKNFGKDLGAVEFSLDWNESLHPRDPSGTAEGGQFASKPMPTSMGQLTHVKPLGGTTGAQLYQDKDGNKFVVKSGASPEHAANEVLANKLYRALGVLVPRTELVDGKLVARLIDGKPLNELSKAEQELAEKELSKHFAADALLGNWDVVGLNKDNIIVDKKGRPWRVDNGGALAFRAKGGPKGTKWNADVSELDSMRNKDVAGQVFGKHLTDAAVKEQVKGLMNKVNNEALAKFQNQVDKTFIERVDTIDDMVKGTKFYPFETSAKAAHKELFPNLYKTTSTPAPAKVSAPAPTSTGKGIPYKEKEAWLKENLEGESWTDHQMAQAAIMNHDPAQKKVFVSWYWTKDQQKELADLHPGKEAKVVEASKHIKKIYGVTTKDIAKGLHDPAFGVVTPSTKPTGKIDKTVVPPEPLKHTPALSTKVKIGGVEVQELVSGGKWDSVKEEGNYKTAVWKVEMTSEEKGSIGHWKGSPDTVRSAQLHMAGIKSDSPHAGKKYKSALQNYEMADLPAAASHITGSRDAAIKTAKQFESAVAKAPKFDGVTYRGVRHLSPGTTYHTALTTPGTTVEMLTHACTSRENNVALGFSSGNTIIRMRAKSGGVIEDVSGFKGEHEVAMPKGTTFRVVRHATNIRLNGSNVKTVIDLEEVEPHDTSVKVALSLVDALALSHGDRKDRFQETEPGVNWIVRLPIDKVIGPE